MGALTSTGFYMVNPCIAKYAVSTGATVAVAGVITGLFSITALVARPVSGLMADRLNRRLLLTAATAVLALSALSYSFAGTVPLLVAVRIVHGIAFAVSGTVNVASDRDPGPPEPAERRGRLLWACQYFCHRHRPVPRLGDRGGDGISGFVYYFLHRDCLRACPISVYPCEKPGAGVWPERYPSGRPDFPAGAAAGNFRRHLFDEQRDYHLLPGPLGGCPRDCRDQRLLYVERPGAVVHPPLRRQTGRPEGRERRSSTRRCS